MRFNQKSQPTEFVFTQIKSDYILETIVDPKVNWRPRKAYLDGPYIDANPTSSVDFVEIQEIYQLAV